ncbi:GNAT family N-acetyltransferase [Arcticibacterium luteifluviistationis]|uniref:GNAT family N-acetyltransferase n=1 Tax=Arcticibacterium luteifluviistationis TaxID=1784714 RepID=A0A2Z4G9V0_9BACT|nr:GNAT family N-acetyltransferase [Arcticibacterium luteifluviistationis]AWV98012.1 GNAT family N-acetyltransferase [Arcticibacterium luteifluviistationis]
MTMKVLEKTFYKEFIVQVATSEHEKWAVTITDEMASSAAARGTGIAKRTPEYIISKMQEGKAIIALTKDNVWAGFCYIETWEHGRFVANSGLIVHPDYRKSGVATAIKAKAFRLSRQKYPDANLIGLTTSMAVMKINSELGYEPVSFSELPQDDAFWKGCQTCKNYDILTRTNRSHCLCTGMKYNVKQPKNEKRETWEFVKESSLYEKWLAMKQRILIKKKV